jgi:hypothetical protein
MVKNFSLTDFENKSQANFLLTLNWLLPTYISTPRLCSLLPSILRLYAITELLLAPNKKT